MVLQQDGVENENYNKSLIFAEGILTRSMGSLILII